MKTSIIQTLHPEEGKKNKAIPQEKYDVIKGSILKALKHAELTHTELLASVSADVKDAFEGNANWHTETVKLDLEARYLVKRTNTKPQKYFLNKA